MVVKPFKMARKNAKWSTGSLPTILQFLRAILMGLTTIDDPSDSPKSDLEIGLDNTKS